MLEIRAIVVKNSSVGDSPILPELLAQIPLDEPVASICGDGSYNPKGCHAVIAQTGPGADTPAQERKAVEREAGGGRRTQRSAAGLLKAWARYLDEWSGYHRRSLMETKMHGCIPMGERVMARTFERQVAELHVRGGLLNRFAQLGRPTTVPVSAVA
jgi:hypothetical protein